MGPQVLLPPGSGLVLEQVQLWGEIVYLLVRWQRGAHAARRAHAGLTRSTARANARLPTCPIADRQVVVHLKVRRFRCPEPTCPRCTFVALDGPAELPPPLTTPLEIAAVRAAVEATGRGPRALA